jgi:hypothetical protein
MPNAAFYKKHRERLLLESKLRKNWRKKTPEQNFSTYLKSLYGITTERYNDILNSQNGKCAICKGDEVHRRHLSVDHCHETGQIRGLLCVRCNAAIGHFKDDSKILKHAIEYLEEWYDVGLAFSK